MYFSRQGRIKNCVRSNEGRVKTCITTLCDFVNITTASQKKPYSLNNISFLECIPQTRSNLSEMNYPHSFALSCKIRCMNFRV